MKHDRLFGMRVLVSEHLPREHYATAFEFIPDHPIWAWVQRNVWRRKFYPGGFFMRGPDLTRPGAMYVMNGDTIVCSPEQHAELMRVSR